MKPSGLQRETLIACIALGGVAAVVGSSLGQPLLGEALGAGVVVGSLNVLLLPAMVERGAHGALAGFIRISLFSSTALGIALVIGAPIWTLAIGLGLAQIVMAVASARQGLRA